jgi:uncharacterized protein involved in exopolysaccharide biosynthesis
MNIRQLFDGLRQDWMIFAGVVIATVAASVVVALLSKPVYRSEVSLVAVPEDGMASGLAGLAGQFGGLASLAGLALPKGGNWSQAVANLRSRHMIEQLVTSLDLLPQLFPEDWDESRKGWRAGLRQPPTMGDAVFAFRQRILQVREDAKTGVVTVRIDWHDPVRAAEWANGLVALADQELRAEAVTGATAMLEALKSELARAEQVELRTAISRLMEAQVKSKMFAAVRQEFAFHVIDPAVPSDLDKRVQPTRTVIVVAGGVLGVLLGLVAVFLRHEWRLAARSRD